jgi:glucosamine--fructose-6-phosphate aminotransferase (isomerizing)
MLDPGTSKEQADYQEGSFAFVFKSIHFPDEIVATRRGSPLLIGVKTDRKLKVDFVDVELASEDRSEL